MENSTPLTPGDVAPLPRKERLDRLFRQSGLKRQDIAKALDLSLREVSVALRNPDVAEAIEAYLNSLVIGKMEAQRDEMEASLDRTRRDFEKLYKILEDGPMSPQEYVIFYSGS